MTTWAIDNGKILADGTIQDVAMFLWTLKSEGQNINIERQVILQEKRLPLIARMAFGKEREAAFIAARKQLGQVETIALVQDATPCTIPAEYRDEIGKELRQGNASKLADFLGL